MICGQLTKKVRNQYKFKLNEAKRSVISNKVLECKGDTKALYKLLTEITGGKTDNTFPPGKSDTENAEDLASDFMSKINNIRNKFPKVPQYEPQNKNVLPTTGKQYGKPS